MTKLQRAFRVRYFASFGSLQDVDIAVRDTDAAIRAAREGQWPENAIGFRLIDAEGREVFEELRAERH